MRLRKLDYVVLIVAELDRAVAFYENVLGLTLQHRAEKFAQFDAGGTRLGLYTRDAMQTTLETKLHPPFQTAPAFEIGFKVADCDTAFSELVRAGAPAVVKPTTRPWGQRTAYVRDPDGNLIELAQDLAR